MKKENLKLLEILANAGYTDETSISKIGLTEVVLLKLTFPQIVLLEQLQNAIKAGKLLPWIVGKYPDPKKAAPSVEE